MDTQERDQLIAKLLSEGISLSDVQKTLEREHDIRMTYMDLRLIVSGLEVDWKKLDGEKEEESAADDDGESEVVEADATVEGGPGATRVNISKIARPGAVMHGDVVFASGKTADWYLDQMGRLGLNPTNDSGQPDQTDLEEFQIELQQLMQRGGGM